jgi:hypothetical protein
VSWEGQEEEGQNLREGRRRSGMPWREARKRGPTGRGLRYAPLFTFIARFDKPDWLIKMYYIKEKNRGNVLLLTSAFWS